MRCLAFPRFSLRNKWGEEKFPNFLIVSRNGFNDQSTYTGDSKPLHPLHLCPLLEWLGCKIITTCLLKSDNNGRRNITRIRSRDKGCFFYWFLFLEGTQYSQDNKWRGSVPLGLFPLAEIKKEKGERKKKEKSYAASHVSLFACWSLSSLGQVLESRLFPFKCEPPSACATFVLWRNYCRRVFFFLGSIWFLKSRLA